MKTKITAKNPEKISMLGAIRSCISYPKLSSIDRNTLREKRLHAIVNYACENSLFYKKLYQDIDLSNGVVSLPVVTKSDLMNHYQDWITDPTLSYSEIQSFISDRKNLGSKYKGKYSVHTTSGSTGIPLVLLSDASQTNAMNAITLLRSIPSKDVMKSFIRKSGRSMGVYADNGFYLGNSSIHAKQKAFPWKKKQIGLVDALLPTNQIVEKLNRFQPVMLGGYPSNLELLIQEQKKGSLHIHPVLIMTGGEYLSDALRAELSAAFSCPVYTTYACTEGGTIACECACGHLHINDDWMYIEAVDRNNQPVAEGQLSDKILLTNLSNYIQPLIRYEVTDRVRIHRGCSCGNPSPWLEIEGRTDDIVIFEQEDRDIAIAPLAIYACLKEVPEIRRFQLLVAEGNRVSLRLLPADECSKDETYQKAKSVLLPFFQSHGVSQIDITLSDDEPAAGKNGKYKHVVKI